MLPWPAQHPQSRLAYQASPAARTGRQHRRNPPGVAGGSARLGAVAPPPAPPLREPDRQTFQRSCGPWSAAYQVAPQAIDRSTTLTGPDRRQRSLGRVPVWRSHGVGASLRRHAPALWADSEWAARITIGILWIFLRRNIFPNDSGHLEFRPRISVNRRGDTRLCGPTFPSPRWQAQIADFWPERKKIQISPSSESCSEKRFPLLRGGCSYIGTNGERIQALRLGYCLEAWLLNVVLCENQNSQSNQLSGIFIEYRIKPFVESLTSQQINASVGIKIHIFLFPSIRIISLADLAIHGNLNHMLLARNHQAEAIGFCLRSLKSGHARCVVQMPTGSGKSYVIRRLAQEWIKDGGNALVLCPTEEVIEQQRRDSLREGMVPVIEKAEQHASQYARYIIGSVNTMWHRCEKHRRKKSLLLVDECHHFNYDAPTNMKIANVFERAIGFSATPWSIGCLDFFENRTHIYPLSQSIRDQVNCKYHIEEWIEPIPGKYQIVYCSSFEEIQQMCLRIAPSDFAAYQAADARRTISRFRFGFLGTIVVNRMLTEGFDQPQIKRIWIARNTESQIAALQMAGRALRPYKEQAATIYVQSEQTRNTLISALERAR